MANELKEEIIIIQDSDAAYDNNYENSTLEKKPSNNKPLVIIGIATAIIIIIKSIYTTYKIK